MQPGPYRFTALRGGLLDRFGNPLDGNGDGTGGDDLVRSFSVVIPAGQVLESRSNDSIPAATPLPLVEDPAGSGFFTSSAIALGAIDPASDSDYWSFAAQQGDRLIIDLERTSGSVRPAVHRVQRGRPELLDSILDSYWFGSPRKAHQLGVYTIPADGHVLRAGALITDSNGTGSYQFRVDLGRGSSWNRTTATSTTTTLNQAANYPPDLPGRRGRDTCWPGGRVAVLAGRTGLLPAGSAGSGQPGGRRAAARSVVSSLNYKVQVVGKTVGLLPDAGRQPTGRAGQRRRSRQSDDYFVKVEAI